MVSNPLYLATGWMFAHSETMQQLQQYHSDFQSVVDGYELHPTSESRVEAYQSLRLPTEFEYSLHSTPTQHPSELESLIRRADPVSIVYHPEPELDTKLIVDALSSYSVTPILENLDDSQSLDEADLLLEDAFSESFGFVLDVQHVYEHDPTMEYGIDLLEEYGEFLVEVHISGTINGSNHELIHRSDNKAVISSFVRRVADEYPDVPLVIEGKYQSVGEVASEVSFIRELEE